MNKYNPNIHHRRSIRLKGYDYTQAGLYFITICCHHRKCLFGEIKNGEMTLNDAGMMVENEWLKLPERFTNIQLHEYIVMPNHFHAILEIVGATLVVAQNDTVVRNDVIVQNDVIVRNDAATQNNAVNQNDDKQLVQPKGQPKGFAPKGETKIKTVGDMVGAFQSIVTVQYIRGVKTMGWTPFNGKLWQRNYYEHIIRNEKSFNRISEYILNNPSKWTDDKFHIV